jgi:hypothetical protein
MLSALPESEAMAQFLQKKVQNLTKEGEAFIVLDTGASVKATTYRVAKSDPFRLEQVQVTQQCNTGAQSLNDTYRDCIVKRLSGQVEWAREEAHVKDLADHEVFSWEYNGKRVYDGETDPCPVFIPGLKGDDERNFATDYMRWTKDDINRMFEPILHSIEDILEQRLQKAKVMDIKVSKVLLIGGFGGCQLLLKRLKKRLSIDLIDLEVFEKSAVVQGAVAKALGMHLQLGASSRKRRADEGSSLHDLSSPLKKGYIVTRSSNVHINLDDATSAKSL